MQLRCVQIRYFDNNSRYTLDCSHRAYAKTITVSLLTFRTFRTAVCVCCVLCMRQCECHVCERAPSNQMNQFRIEIFSFVSRSISFGFRRQFTCYLFFSRDCKSYSNARRRRTKSAKWMPIANRASIYYYITYTLCNQRPNVTTHKPYLPACACLLAISFINFSVFQYQINLTARTTRLIFANRPTNKWMHWPHTHCTKQYHLYNLDTPNAIHNWRALQARENRTTHKYSRMKKKKLFRLLFIFNLTLLPSSRSPQRAVVVVVSNHTVYVFVCVCVCGCLNANANTGGTIIIKSYTNIVAKHNNCNEQADRRSQHVCPLCPKCVSVYLRVLLFRYSIHIGVWWSEWENESDREQFIVLMASNTIHYIPFFRINFFLYNFYGSPECVHKQWTRASVSV